MTKPAFERILPELSDQTRHFWQGGQEGHLQVLQCESCSYYIHPPLPICPKCRSRQVAVVQLSGRATVASFTINFQPWFPGLEVPYCVAIVELAEQEGLRLTTNIVRCDLKNVTIGLPVRVTFEQFDDVWLPFFEPDTHAPEEKNNAV